MTWVRRWLLRLRLRHGAHNVYLDGMREGYRHRGPEDGPCATLQEFDSDGVYRNRPMYERDVPAFIEAEFERSDSVQAVD